MRVVFESAPVPVTTLFNGSKFSGLLRFQAQVYSAEEPGIVLQGGRIPPAAADWLKQVNAQDKVVISPPPIALQAPPVEVPAALLRAIPADAYVAMEWEWRRLR
jgi:hypothetical protein